MSVFSSVEWQAHISSKQPDSNGSNELKKRDKSALLYILSH